MAHKILVVDDEESLRLVLKHAFAGVYEVLTAAGGEAAVEIIGREKPALVFLDIRMRGISGLEVLRKVKGSNSAPVIWMLTGEDDLDTAMEALRLGADGYLTKPFDVGQVRDIAENVIAGRERKIHHDTSEDKPWKKK